MNILGYSNLLVIFKDKLIRRFTTFIASNIFKEILSFEQMMEWKLSYPELPFKQKKKLNSTQCLKVLNNKVTLAQKSSNNHTHNPSSNTTITTSTASSIEYSTSAKANQS